jgi:two-component system, NarL family, sensor kinase
MLAEQISRDIRTLSYLLHPPHFDEEGLPSALQWYGQGFEERSGVQLELDIPPTLGRLPQDVEMALFRVVQESLTNIHRHTGSSEAKIAITKSPDQVTLEVKDNGRGMSPLAAESVKRRRADLGVGTAGMQQRIRQLGGKFEIGSRGQGTTVRVVLPLLH